MKHTSSKTKDSVTGTPDLDRDSNRSPNRHDFSFEEFLRGPEIEKKDPCVILYHALSRSHEEVVPLMLEWYRSGDLWKVIMASTYFQHSNVLETIDDLIRGIQSEYDDEARTARGRLPIYGEIALRKVLRTLSGRPLQVVLREIFFRMDGQTIPLVLKSLRKESFSVKMTILRSLTGRRNRHALPVLFDLMTDIEMTPSWKQDIDMVSTWGTREAQPALN